ncbi:MULTISPECIES: ABC transporter ATP-binding protein [unclassified Leucobacter]|uniref:ABC transporter ATP-binding protein n=1 Tax=unclassified Leucobacter TaxID=2621730 RepID=UPI00069A2E53|nr:ABC transporter ATP-binding protein [Leucobacter sp. Ag1]
MTRALPVASARATARASMGLLLRDPWRLAAATLLLAAGAAAGLLVPWLLGSLVDAVIAGRDALELALRCAALLGSGAVAAGLEWGGGVLLVGCLQRALARLREDVFAAALSIDLGRVEEAGSGDIVARVTGDVEAVTDAVSGVLPRFLQAGFTIVLTAVGLTAVDPWLALGALLAVPIQVWITVRFLRRSRPIYTRLRREEALRGQVIIDSVAGADTVRAHRLQQDRLGRIAEASLRAVETQREAARARNRFVGGLNLAEFVGLGAVLAIGFVRAGAGALSIGGVTAGALFFHRLFGPIGGLLGSIDDLQRALAGLERLVGVQQLAGGGVGAGAGFLPGRSVRPIEDATIRIESASYRYPGARADALSGISLMIPAGSTLALVGASGSGKSTLGRLIAGIGGPGSGTVRVGGAPAETASLPGRGGSAARPAVLLVTQESHLFGGTVADNLRLADPGADDGQLAAALRRVGRDPGTLPDGLGTVPEPDHLLLQQIALARVLLADPAVVVLDEATAHAGPDGVLEDALREVGRGRTSIVIAHRLTQALDADRVAVLEGGALVECAPPSELLDRSDGHFARLWRAWSG